MNFDVLIVGGGVSGMQCALVLGSANKKAFAANKNIGIISHQKISHLQNALFNNVLGLKSGKLGSEILLGGYCFVFEQRKRFVHGAEAYFNVMLKFVRQSWIQCGIERETERE